jgi:hypothetical protein
LQLNPEDQMKVNEVIAGTGSPADMAFEALKLVGGNVMQAIQAIRNQG